MSVLLLPQFIVDLQEKRSAHFASRVLEKTLHSDGSFLMDADDHRFKGVENAWIRHVSRGRTAYRVIYLRSDKNIYLFRAGEHSVEKRLVGPSAKDFETAVSISGATPELEASIAKISAQNMHMGILPTSSGFRRNDISSKRINQEIFSRRNLPHRDIWLITPFINTDILLPTAQFGQFLFDQVEDGANVSIFTSPPKDNNIEWMEMLADRSIDIFVYPKLHTKLYCFVLDENRRHDRGVPDSDKIQSLILVGSADLTKAGLALENGSCNEELCYVVPEYEMGYVETYVTNLIIHGYELPDVRMRLAHKQWQKPENPKW